jgi:hypothetical protein
MGGEKMAGTQVNHADGEYDTPSAVFEQTKPGEHISYDIGKITFIVTPVYRDGEGKTVHDILLNLMENDCENP